jgi:hypothetical protein
MTRYGLASHVFVCRSEAHVVVLDIRQDRYFMLDAARTATLAQLLPGWPGTPATSDTDSQTAPEHAAAPLLKRGWLLEASNCSKAATPPTVRPSQSELLTGLDEMERMNIDLRIVIRFLGAFLFAKFALRRHSFERVINRVRDRKAAHWAGGQPLDIVRARQLVQIFVRLRMFLISHQDKCLQDSLALLEFLAGYNIFPSWIFGVRTKPFSAHCWVQYEDLAFNDVAEHVSTFIPIMVV